MDLHHRYMARALRAARRGLYTTHPNPRVGCVLVKDGEVLAEGWHQRAGGPHAEIVALSHAGAAAGSATAYISLEPCAHHGRTPPCADALVKAGVREVVVAMRDPDPRVAGAGITRLQAAGARVIVGIMETEARELNRGFLSRHERGRPWLRLKLATSLDSRTAMASGESRWVTGTAARADVQLLRAQADAVMSGIGTVLADDPALNVRLAAAQLGIDGPVRQPLRVILDTRLRLPCNARMLSLPGPVLVYTAHELAADGSRRYTGAVELQGVDRVGGRLDLPAVMSDLAARGVGEVHLECGPTLAGAMLEAELVDELVVYMAPHLMGSGAKGLANLPGIQRMSNRIDLSFVDLRMVGGDLRITLMPRR